MTILLGSIQIWNQPAADWTSENPVLLDGQEGSESDTGFRKIGDGTTAWNDLDYLFTQSITSTPGILAHAGGGQLNATVLTAMYNRVDTVVTDGDSVKCFQALHNKMIVAINNDPSQSMDVYPLLGDLFLGLAPNVAIPIAAGNQLRVLCFEDGIWTQI